MLATVVPPAFDSLHSQPALLGVSAVDVGDLELAAVRRREAVDDVVHVRRVAVEPDDRVARRRCVIALVDIARLLDDVGDRAVVAVHDDAEVLRVGHVLREDERAVVPRGDRIGLRVLEDVVAEADDELLSGGEVARHADHLRDPAGFDLHLVGQVEVEQQLVAVARHHAAVAEEVDELTRMLLAGDEEHLAHADALQQLERVVDHRPAPDRQQVLVRDSGELREPRGAATGGNEAFHAVDAIATSAS